MLAPRPRGWHPLTFCALLAASACTPRDGESVPPMDTRDDERLPTIGAFAAELSLVDGFLPLYQDPAKARVYARLGPEAQQRDALQLIYYSGLSTGLGANPVGVDRGELGDTQLVAVNRMGERYLLEALNFDQRASSEDPNERRAAADAFPRSVLGSVPIVALDDDGSALVDLTDFLLRDAHGIVAHFDARDEGVYTLDAGRSAFDGSATLNFPDNTELEALVTYVSDAPGPWSGSTAPDGGALSFRQHHTFVRLPDDDYIPREASPRMGHFSLDHLDFSAAIEKPLERRWVVRHRLSRDEPLVYYVDAGTPEPIRSALIEGASWWGDAFAAAGFPGGFEVRVLPDGAHPLDVRYNVVNWVHRTTRGWSYGASVVDPRTGEIIKGHVTLGSQRIRQDRRIFEGLLGSAQSGRGGPDDPVELALARVRQLAAHEVGHTLGFEHNFGASSYGRASVMDYPAPLVRMKNGKPDLTDAYARGIGAWDKVAFEYLYREWDSPEAEAAGLATIMSEAINRGMIHLSDAETHAPGASHPEANVWDNGEDAVSHLRELLEVREWGLEHFDESRLARDADPTSLELSLGPLYFMHRYQMAAVAKRLGGERFDLGAATPLGVRRVSAADQRAALEILLDCLGASTLALPDELSSLLEPTPEQHIDQLDSWSGPNFDPHANAAAAARLVVDALLEPHRAHRMNLHHAADANSPSFDELLDALVDRVTDRKALSDAPELTALSQQVVAESLMALATNDEAGPDVRAQAEAAVMQLGVQAQKTAPRGSAGVMPRSLSAEILRWAERPYAPRASKTVNATPPPGSPIGSAQACGAN